MIVFRKQESLDGPGEALARVARVLERLRNAPNHENAVELLVEYGEYESAVTDVLCPQTDTSSAETEMLRLAGMLTGRVLFRSWERRDYSGLCAEAAEALEKLKRIDAGESICLRCSEGFAHYGIFPEMYILAARKFFLRFGPVPAACIGLRSIGTGLSSVAGAALGELGCAVRTFTVRPRGHPYDRSVSISPTLREKILAGPAGECFILVDEGPGLSGSSFASLARELRRWGLEDERIILFPCWEPDGSEFFSGYARSSWNRLAKYSASFEETWLATGRLRESLGLDAGAPLQDISAGNWRQLCRWIDGWPAAHPHHEQRKYLCCSGAGESGTRLVKFAGLGRYGRRKFERAQRLAAAGLCPRPEALRSGFLVSSWEEGSPLAAGAVSAGLLQTMARYLAYLKANFPAGPDLNGEAILCMTELNIAEGLGPQWAQKAARLAGMKSLLEGEPTEIDGRMLPHEWLALPGPAGDYLKADALDHHADQFFPKRQDICWDLAGTVVEFGLDHSQENFLLERYTALSGDGGGGEKLPLYKICYLSYRLGYCTLAQESLRGAPEAARFGALRARYAGLLKAALSEL